MEATPKMLVTMPFEKIQKGIRGVATGATSSRIGFAMVSSGGMEVGFAMVSSGGMEVRKKKKVVEECITRYFPSTGLRQRSPSVSD